MDPVENLSTFASRLFGLYFINKDKRKKRKTDWIKTVIDGSYNTHIPYQW